MALNVVTQIRMFLCVALFYDGTQFCPAYTWDQIASVLL